MLCYWYHFSHHGKRIEVRTDDDSIAAHFLHLLHGKPASELWIKAMHTSLILYAEHEFNASTFTARVIAGTGSDLIRASPARSAPCAARSTAAPTRSRSRSRSATTRPMRPRPTSARGWPTKEVVIGFGHPVYTIADPRNEVIKGVAQQLAEAAGDVQHYEIAERIETVMRAVKNLFPESRLVLAPCRTT